MKSSKKSTKEQTTPLQRKGHTRREAIKLGALILGVALPAVITLTPTEARAQSSSP
jgi:hypothetical protein